MNGESALSNLRTTVQIAHNQGSKAILAIGGWFHIHGGESYDYFRVAISNPVSRTKLINELISMVEEKILMELILTLNILAQMRMRKT